MNQYTRQQMMAKESVSAATMIHSNHSYYVGNYYICRRTSELGQGKSMPQQA